MMDSEAHAVRRDSASDYERSRIEEKMAETNRYVCTVLAEEDVPLVEVPR